MISQFSIFVRMIGKTECLNKIDTIGVWWVFPIIGFLSFGCSDPEVKPDQLSVYRNDVTDYFAEVALGFEFGSASRVTRKWNNEIKIFIGGEKSTEMLDELDRILTELEELSTEFSFSITADTSQSNYYIFFGSGSSFAARFPPAQQHVATNWGLFYVYFNASNEIHGAAMYVDTERATQAEARKHLLREEFTQSLGLARDSDRYPQSIFYAPWTTVTEYSPIDRDLIRLLYHPSMPTGLDETAVRNLLKDLLIELEIGV